MSRPLEQLRSGPAHRAVRITLSTLSLVLIALLLGLLLAALLGGALWGITAALHHAANN